MSAETLLLLALALAGYAYLGYPLLVLLGARLLRRPRSARVATDEPPALTVVIAARNEAAGIADRLRNLLDCDYPADRLHIVVADDGSDDATADSVASLSDRRIELVSLPRPSGKAVALNAAMARVGTPLTVFADARQRFERGALRALAAPFADSRIGAVAGELQIVDAGAEGDPVAADGAYWRFERALREAESRLGWSHAASGAIYAIRTKLFRPLPAGLLLDDVYTPLQVVRSGARIEVAADAIAFDRVGRELRGEFRRKLRTLTGNWQLLAHLPWLLNPIGNPLFFAWLSHKFVRLLAPWALLLALVAAALSTHPLAQLAFVLQVAAYLLALSAIFAPRLACRIPLASTAGSFLTLNAAALLSLPVYLGRRDLGHLWKSR